MYFENSLETNRILKLFQFLEKKNSLEIIYHSFSHTLLNVEPLFFTYSAYRQENVIVFPCQ